jgi:glucose-1-phosphate cytidylyltransferase
MKVVILCGGKGTRLREETEYQPKPLVPIGEMPIFWHIMKIYSYYGHKDFILCLGYKGEKIKSWFRNFKWNTSDVEINLKNYNFPKFHSYKDELDWNVILAETGKETMTGARIKQIEKYIGDDEDFLLTYGDGVGTIDINKSIQFHKDSNKTLTLTGVNPPGRWGELKVKNGIIENFSEKPKEQVSRVNGGYFVAKKKLFEYLNDDPKLVFESQPLEKLSRDKELVCYEHNGFWRSMDTYAEFLLLNEMWAKGQAKWKVWE